MPSMGSLLWYVGNINNKEQRRVDNEKKTKKTPHKTQR